MPKCFRPRRVLRWTLAVTAMAGAPWNAVSAQEARQFQVSGGPAASFAGDGRDGHGFGAGVSVEYVADWTRWASGRLYAGGILTKPD
jgi:hypothetical protein